MVRHGFDELLIATTARRRPNGTPVARVAALILGQFQALARRRDLVILLHQVRGLMILQPTAFAAGVVARYVSPRPVTRRMRAREEPRPPKEVPDE